MTGPQPLLNRRELLNAAVTAGAVSAVSVLDASADEQPSPGIRVTDTNVSLFQWPFRRLPLDKHGIRSVRVHPNYHGYTLEDHRFRRLLEVAAEANCFVQIAVSMEDPRTQNALVRVADVDPAPLTEVVSHVPNARVQILNLGILLVSSTRPAAALPAQNPAVYRLICAILTLTALVSGKPADSLIIQDLRNDGLGRNPTFPHAWRYRDYVIAANERLTAPATDLHMLQAAPNVPPPADFVESVLVLESATGIPKLIPKSKWPVGAPLAMGVRDRIESVDCKLNIDGDARKLGAHVPRGFIEACVRRCSQRTSFDMSIRIDRRVSHRDPPDSLMRRPGLPSASRCDASPVRPRSRPC